VGPSVVWSSPTPSFGAGSWVLLPLALAGRTVLRFAGGAFAAPNDRRLGEAVGSSRLARRGCTAVPGCETPPAWRCQARMSLLLAVVN
jgi:hypothetical protein